MHTERGNFLVTPYSKALVKFKARRLSRCRGFRPSDQDDLEQTLWVALLKEAGKFNPARASLNTFIDRVVNPAAAMILRNRKRLKRAAGFEAQSLDAEAPGGGNSTDSLAGSISIADQLRRLGLEPRDEAELREIAEAVSDAISRMPKELGDRCRKVMDGGISAAARDLNVARRQVRKAMHAARPFLERVGFGE